MLLRIPIRGSAVLSNNEGHASTPKQNGDEKNVVETDSFGSHHRTQTRWWVLLCPGGQNHVEKLQS